MEEQVVAIFTVQGSSPEPYTITVSFDPFYISCTCQAAVVGNPCKHRIQIAKGYCENMVDTNCDPEKTLPLIAEMVSSTNIFELLDDYKEARNIALEAKRNSEKTFKKYRDATVAAALKEGTQKAITKASEELSKIILKCAESAAEVKEILRVLQAVFVRPE